MLLPAVQAARSGQTDALQQQYKQIVLAAHNFYDATSPFRSGDKTTPLGMIYGGVNRFWPQSILPSTSKKRCSNKSSISKISTTQTDTDNALAYRNPIAVYKNAPCWIRRARSTTRVKASPSGRLQLRGLLPRRRHDGRTGPAQAETLATTTRPRILRSPADSGQYLTSTSQSESATSKTAPRTPSPSRKWWPAPAARPTCGSMVRLLSPPCAPTSARPTQPGRPAAESLVRPQQSSLPDHRHVLEHVCDFRPQLPLGHGRTRPRPIAPFARSTTRSIRHCGGRWGASTAASSCPSIIRPPVTLLGGSPL